MLLDLGRLQRHRFAVLHVWTGAYDSEQKPDVERGLGVALPGMDMNASQ